MTHWYKIKNSLFNNFSLKVILVFILFLVLFFLADFLTKYFLFDKNNMYLSNDTNTYKDFLIFGIRSVSHNNSTIFSALNIRIPLEATYLINFTFAIIFTIPIFNSKSILLSFILALIVAGILGNSIDKIITTQPLKNGDVNYVMDIFYLPWLDRGTFNLADIMIVLGSGLLFIKLVSTLVADFINKN